VKSKPVVKPQPEKSQDRKRKREDPTTTKTSPPNESDENSNFREIMTMLSRLDARFQRDLGEVRLQITRQETKLTQLFPACQDQLNMTPLQFAQMNPTGQLQFNPSQQTQMNPLSQTPFNIPHQAPVNQYQASYY